MTRREDFGIIEKIVDAEGGRVFFVIAGLGSRGTRGCGWWLARNWDTLVNEFGGGEFGVVLQFPAGLDSVNPKWLNRPGQAGPQTRLAQMASAKPPG